jgi:hypothetical protein
MLEAGLRQFQELIPQAEREESQFILVAVGRYLAAHAPTERATTQTARIALRLHRGEELYRDEM